MIRNTILNIALKVWPTIFLSIVILTSTRIVYLLKNKKKIILYKELLTLLFVIYVLCLFYIVTFQDVSFNNSNFVLFREMLRYDFGSKLFIKNVIGNVILFLPYGFFMTYYLKLDRLKSIFGLSLLISLTIETTQLMIGRVFDIDDIILNVIGGIVGFYIYKLMEKINVRLPLVLKKPIIYNIIMVFLLTLFLVYLIGIRW